MPKAVTKKKPAKNTKPRKKKSVLETQWNPDKKLTDKEELFVRYYVLNEDTRLNATRAYDFAYDKKLESQSKDDTVYGTRPSKDGEGMEKYVEKPSSYDRVHAVCRVEGNKLLTKPYIEKRKIQLLNELMTNEFVDSELMKVVAQDKDRPSKVRAINEFNKLGGRILNKEAHVHSFANEDMTDEELMKRVEEQRKFFAKE